MYRILIILGVSISILIKICSNRTMLPLFIRTSIALPLVIGKTYLPHLLTRFTFNLLTSFYQSRAQKFHMKHFKTKIFFKNKEKMAFLWHGTKMQGLWKNCSFCWDNVCKWGSLSQNLLQMQPFLAPSGMVFNFSSFGS